MKRIQVVDATLRDGGCVIDFNFGDSNIDTILEGLNNSGVDCIELGYIHETKGTERGRTQFVDEKAVTQVLRGKKQKGTTYLAMMDYGTFNVDKLSQHSDEMIDGIRLAFHKKNFQEVGKIGRAIIDKGYQLFIQPMLTLWYDDHELLELIDLVNQELPEIAAFYIVDSFGEMRNNDVIRILNLVDHNLKKSIPVGFHSHNNLQLSYSNVISVLQFPTTRDLYLDSSIMGMGKGAGNLISELLLEHLNLYYGKQYEISPLLNVIDLVLNRIRANDYWGYSAEYYLSAINHCSPSYARHFQQKHMLPINEIAELLGRIDVFKRTSFDKKYADELYRSYVTKTIDDRSTCAALNSIFAGKEVLVLAPGRSIEREKEKILDYIATNDVIVLAINTVYQNISADYIFISNRKRYKRFCELFSSSTTPLICTSNIRPDIAGVYYINYADYLCEQPCIESNAGMMALNFLLKFGVKRLTLAGFDGFGFEKHASDTLPDAMTNAECNLLNHSISEHISEICKKVDVKFLTKSNYVIV